MTTIRALQDDDAAAYLAWRGGDAYKNEIIGQEITEHFAGGQVIFIAVDDAGLVGTVQLVLAHNDPDLADGAGIGYVKALYVCNTHRRHGVGAGLMAALEAEALRRGCHRLTLMVEPDNDVAIQMYLKRGYVAFKESVWVWRGKDRPTVCMRKEIS